MGATTSKFSFLPTEFRTIAESAIRAEGHIMGDPRAACFHARFALESAVHWLYRHDAALRMEAVERFEDRAAWQQLSENDRETLQRELAGLPSEIATDDIESRLFDLTALRMQLALVEGDLGGI